METDSIYKKLAAPFPAEEVKWRSGRSNRDKTLTLPFCYVDARTVMDRLDEVCGPEGWQCRYSQAEVKTICEILIKSGNGEWLSKANGAGDSDIESEKGAISDAFKRAAVMWGIGRYLYKIKAPYVSTDERGNIRAHEYERLYGLLPGASKNRLTVTGPTGAVKSPGKFWKQNSLNLLDSLPKAYQDEEGNVDWDNQKTLPKLYELINNAISKSPTLELLEKLRIDNNIWVIHRFSPPDAGAIFENFSIRSSQFK